ncbi:ABC transporter permease [bacterium]|nr:ABC transporter permease [bacterium]
MSKWRTMGLVALREFEARRKALLITSLILLTVAAAGVTLAGLLAESEGVTITAQEADEALGFISVIVLFLGIIFTGQVIMEGVAEEKRSRVVEVILGTMLPRHLLAGKVAAIGAMGFLEVVLTAGAALTAAIATDLFPVPAGTALGLAIVVIWFVLGFALYSAIYGAAGAMVAPHENVANGAIPINLSLGVAYMVALTTAPAGDNIVLKVMSMIPVTAPLTMPLRIIRDYAEPWEIAVSITLMVFGIWFMIRFAGRLYAGAILRSGKVKWREAWKSSIGG